jgi:RNA polymerase sigma-70 factor (ECF subfamily)
MQSIHKKTNSTQSKIDKDLIVALKKFIRPHARNIHDMEDILQNVLIKILKNGEGISPAGFFSWLQKVSHTTSIDYYRKNKSSSYELQSDKITEPISEESTNEALLSLSKCVRQLLKNLSADDYQIISAVELEGVSQKELAGKNGTNYSSLKSRLQRARLKLKNEILDCCQVELDKRNTLIDIKPKKRNNCCP